MEKSCKTVPKLVLNYSCSATAKKITLRRYKKIVFCQNGHFSVRFFGDFVGEVLNKSLVMFDMCFAKFFLCKHALDSCEGYSGNCSSNWMQISGK